MFSRRLRWWALVLALVILMAGLSLWLLTPASATHLIRLGMTETEVEAIAGHDCFAVGAFHRQTYAYDCPDGYLIVRYAWKATTTGDQVGNESIRVVESYSFMRKSIWDRFRARLGW